MKLRFPAWWAFAAATWVTPAAAADPVPAIRATVQMEFATEAGRLYLIEGSATGEKWETVGLPVVGDGRLHQRIIPPESAGFVQWRVRQTTPAALGPPATALGGKTIVLNDGGKARQLIFFPSIQGVQRGVLKADASHARSFIWKLKELKPNAAVVELTYYDGSVSQVTLQYVGPMAGSFEMRDYSTAGVVQTAEGGGFSLHFGRIRDEPDQAVLPSGLEGRTVLFEEGSAVTVLEFGLDAKVNLLRPDGTQEKRNFRFERTSDQQGNLFLDSDDATIAPVVFQLHLDSQATGNMNRLPLVVPGGLPVPGVLPQPGTFNIPTGPVASNSATGPPRSLGGKTLQLNGEDPVTLTFYDDGTGAASREEDGSIVITPFNYNYAPTDEDEASLALTYPGAKSDTVEDYDLDFSSNSGGSYESSSYQGGELAQGTSGSFNAGGS